MEELFLESVKARDFNQGQSAKIFKKIEETKKPVKVIKHSKEYMVIMEYEEYIKLISRLNDGGTNEEV